MTTVEEITKRLENAPQDVLDKLMGYLDALTTIKSESDSISINQQEEGIRRLEMYRENHESALDFDKVMEEIEKESGR